MSYFTTVNADAPLHWWRCADPGGILFLDIGSATRVPLYTQIFGALPYSGPASEGGACALNTLSHGGNNQALVTFPAHAFTCEIWAYMLDATGAQNNLFELVAGAKLIQVYQVTGGNFGTVIHGNPNNALHTAAAGSSYDAWHHVVTTYDGANLRLYIDGSLEGLVAVVTDMSGSFAVFFGQNSVGVGCNMLAAELAMYDVVLSATQINAHFAAADNTAPAPHWTGGGTYPTGSGGTVPPASDLTDIRAAVYKTFSNS